MNIHLGTLSILLLLLSTTLAGWPAHARGGGIQVPREKNDLGAIALLMTENVPTSGEGYARNVTEVFCPLVSSSAFVDLVEQLGSINVRVEVKTIFGKDEIHISRTIGFLYSQTLVIYDLNEGSCQAYMYADVH